MTATPVEIGSRINRCAVCKIDRKGRFILADHEAERLFGLNEVKLFGQPFIEFLDTADRGAVEHMTINRNPYETVYDSARMTIIDAAGNRIPATVILSVNFGGGNPANYQIVIVREDSETPRLETGVEQDVWRVLVDYLDSTDDESLDLSVLADHMRIASAARSVAIFGIDSDASEQLALSGEPLSEPATDDIAGPSEIRATFCLPDARLGLAVLEIPLTDPSEDEGRTRQKSELVASLLHQYRPLAGSENMAPGQVLPDLDMLNRLGISLVRLHSDQSATCFGSAINTLFDIDDNFANAGPFLKALSNHGNHQAAQDLADYLKISANQPGCPNFHAIVKGMGGEPVYLRIQQTGEAEAASGWLLMLSPVYPGHCSDVVSSGLLSAYTGLIAEELNAVNETAEKLEHEPGGQSSGAGAFHLTGLNLHLDQSRKLVAILDRITSLAANPDKMQPTDISSVVDHGLKQVGLQFPNCKPQVKKNALPTLPAQRAHLISAVQGILLWWAAESLNTESSVEIGSECSGDTCQITFEFGSLELGAKTLRRLFRPGYNLPEPGDVGLSVEMCNLSLVREIARQVGGDVKANSGPGSSTKIQLTFPTK